MNKNDNLRKSVDSDVLLSIANKISDDYKDTLTKLAKGQEDESISDEEENDSMNLD